MEVNQVVKAIPLFDQIKSLESTIKDLDQLDIIKLKKIVLIDDQGGSFELTNFDDDQIKIKVVTELKDFKRSQLNKKLKDLQNI